MQFDLNSHQYWMKRAIDLINNESEVPIAALILKNGELISSATNKIESETDATAHAELIAIRGASKVLGDWRLSDCILYTTLEPCAMCAGAIMNSRISKVIFGAYDYISGACGSKTNLFYSLEKDKHVEIIGGILEEECKNLIQKAFLKNR